MKLVESNVVFDSITHTYHTMKEGEKPLIFPRSVTAVLRDNLFKDEYKDVDPSVLAKAASYGTRIHEEVEMYERTGIEPMSAEAKELVKMRKEQGYEWVESEYIVSDGEYLAGSIDSVWEHEGELAIADIKTTYNFNEEYVTWQLSIYAYLCECQNPTLHIDKLFCCWAKTKKDNGEDKLFFECYPLKRKSVEEVKALIWQDKNLATPTDEPLPVSESDTLPVLMDADAIDAFIALKEKAEAAKEEYDQLTNKLKVLMREQGLKTFDGGRLRLTYTAPSEKSCKVLTFDEKSFKADHPDLYEQYTKESKKTTKSYEKLTVTVREQ